MTTARVSLFVAVASSLCLIPGLADAASLHQSEHGRHHLSLFIGATDLDIDVGENGAEESDAGAGLESENAGEGFSNDTAATVAVDYEYRLTTPIGLGAVVEQTAGAFDATTVLTVADIHLTGGFVLQIGPGVEFIENETNVVGRIGGLYEFEIGRFTVSPQAHYDITGKADSAVFGLALGVNF